jgi:hypothetical protein
MNHTHIFEKLELDVTPEQIHNWRQLATAIKSSGISAADIPILNSESKLNFDKLLKNSNQSVGDFIASNSSTAWYMTDTTDQFHVGRLIYRLTPDHL